MAVVERTDERWQWQAACRELSVDPRIFFPFAAGYHPPLSKRDPGNSRTIDDEQSRCYAALQVCAVCPVREPCLDQAIRERQVDGVWGGTTPTERRVLIRRRARA